MSFIDPGMDDQEVIALTVDAKFPNVVNLFHEDPAVCTFHNILVSIKLSNNNYIIWKHYILKLLRSLELEEYVLHDPPLHELKDGVVNPAHKNWRKQDEMLGCWLMSYVSEDVLK